MICSYAHAHTHLSVHAHHFYTCIAKPITCAYTKHTFLYIHRYANKYMHTITYIQTGGHIHPIQTQRPMYVNILRVRINILQNM